MTEIWRDIPKYEGYYQVSNLGKVKSVKRTIKYKDGRIYKYHSKILKPKKDTKGYLQVSFNVNGLKSNHRIHRLVAETFIGKPKGKLISVNHIDGVKTNNNLANLEWVTYSENTKKGHELGLFDKAVEKTRKRMLNNQYNSKSVVLEIKATNEQIKFNSARKASRAMGYCENYFTQLLRIGGENSKYKIKFYGGFTQ